MKRIEDRRWGFRRKNLDRRWRREHIEDQQQEPEQTTDLSQATATATPRKLPLWLILALCLCGSTIVSFVGFKYLGPALVAPSIPEELVGTWKIATGGMKGATLEFTWHGTAIATEHKQGKTETTHSSVKVEGNKILLTSRKDDTGEPETFVQTIVKLTGNELVIRDEDRQTYRMVRVRQ
jgi:uncharacterized protein (TIGR03066 family)